MAKVTKFKKANVVVAPQPQQDRVNVPPPPPAESSDLIECLWGPCVKCNIEDSKFIWDSRSGVLGYKCSVCHEPLPEADPVLSQTQLPSITSAQEPLLFVDSPDAREPSESSSGGSSTAFHPLVPIPQINIEAWIPAQGGAWTRFEGVLIRASSRRSKDATRRAKKDTSVKDKR
jgi:hypothetical protein